MAYEKKKISFEIPQVALALYPKFIIDVGEIMSKYLNDKKLRHSQINPGEFIIHPDQPLLFQRLKELKDEQQKLEHYENVFEEAGFKPDKKEPERVEKEPEIPTAPPNTEKANNDKPLPNMPKRKGRPKK